MASFVSNLTCYNIRCPSTIDGRYLNKLRLPKIDISKTGSVKKIRATENVNLKYEQTRQNFPTKKQFVDPHNQGHITENGVGYTQTVVIRSYEVGADKTATLESILYLLQETALNHVWMSGLLGDGFGATHEMASKNLMWVVSRIHLQVDRYPIWGEVLELDTWVGASGKNGMRRDWELRSQATGQVFARATSTWVMMNKKTRRLSKMPDKVRAELSSWFIEKQTIFDDTPEKIKKLDHTAKHVNSSLKPKRSDLDMNHHVNSVKYVGWILETMQDEFLEEHQLSDIILEYRKECGSSDIVQSLCEPDDRTTDGGVPLKYTHLLQTKEELKDEEIVRGRTTWRKKHSSNTMFKHEHWVSSGSQSGISAPASKFIGYQNLQGFGVFKNKIIISIIFIFKIFLYIKFNCKRELKIETGGSQSRILLQKIPNKKFKQNILKKKSDKD